MDFCAAVVGPCGKKTQIGQTIAKQAAFFVDKHWVRQTLSRQNEHWLKVKHINIGKLGILEADLDGFLWLDRAVVCAIMFVIKGQF
jgi:hypothetical protein